MEKSPTEYGGPGRGAHTLANTPNIGDFATYIGRTDIGRTEERDTLKSTYVKQQQLFGKATEVAKKAGVSFVSGPPNLTGHWNPT